MSAKKIVRLKTPLKLQQSSKKLDEFFTNNQQFSKESTILLVKNVTCSQQLQVTLINEINKIYKQLARYKQQIQKSKMNQAELKKQNIWLMQTSQSIDKDSKMFKEMYQLQRQNHECLRRFYEERQKQWVRIVQQHKQVLEEYSRYNLQHCKQFDQSKNSINKLNCQYQLSLKSSIRTGVEQKNNIQNQLKKSQKQRLFFQRSPYKFFRQNKIQRRLDSRSSSRSLKRCERIHVTTRVGEKDEKFLEDMSNLYVMGSKFTEQGAKQYMKLQKTSNYNNRLKKSEQQDDFFQQIVRKTYYKYRQKNMLITDIQNLEDMIKLKHANTSTKQRLTKTLRKLNFQTKNDQQLRLLTDYIERSVYDKYQTLRGQYAYQLLVDKLKECEKMANSSDSQLSNLDKQRSKFMYRRPDCLNNSYKNPSQLSSQYQYPNQTKNHSLMLDSRINKGKYYQEHSVQNDQIKDSQIKIASSDKNLSSSSALSIESRPEIKWASSKYI